MSCVLPSWGAVSYTHLDVYKRQALTLAEDVLDATDAGVEAALDDAIEFARQSPLPRAEDALTDAYATVISREPTP